MSYAFWQPWERQLGHMRQSIISLTALAVYWCSKNKVQATHQTTNLTKEEESSYMQLETKHTPIKSYENSLNTCWQGNCVSTCTFWQTPSGISNSKSKAKPSKQKIVEKKHNQRIMHKIKPTIWIQHKLTTRHIHGWNTNNRFIWNFEYLQPSNHR